MLHAFASVVLLAASSVDGAIQWLTVQGDPMSGTVDTVQVAPETITVFEDLRTMQIRVSRATMRNAHDGGKYQSYQATAEIHCATKSAVWKRHEYFTAPLWAGPSRRFVHTGPTQPPMSFASMSPNPVQRIVQAACTLQAVKTG